MFVYSALDAEEWYASSLGRLLRGEIITGSNWVGGRMISYIGKIAIYVFYENVWHCIGVGHLWH